MNTDRDAEKRTISFTLNGREVSVDVDRKTPLLDVLRDRFDIISPKNGCQPQAQCGACAVLLDGKRTLSCTLPAVRVEGREVLTAEGLENEVRDQISRAFVEAGAVQCGYCTPGIVMSAVGLIWDNPNPSRDEIKKALKPHLCRCTGYVKIVDAIERYAASRRGESIESRPVSGGIGTRLPRYEGQAMVLGDRPFVDDLKVEGMLYGAPRLSDHPRAVLKNINPASALAIPGVKKVITAVDIPGVRYQGLIEKDWPVFVAVGEETRCIGDMIAVVVANTRSGARQAAAALDIEYEILEPVCNPHEALKPESPQVHPKGNLLSRTSLKRGEVENTLAESAHTVEGTFYTQRIEHLFLEPESCLAVPDSHDGLKIFSPGQGIFDDRRQIASVLGWEPERIAVELVATGGAFGGKEDMSIQAQTALAAVLCGAPVKITLTREESFRLHPKRHPIELKYRVGCDEVGRLTAVHARIIGDTGAYASVGAKVLERAAGHACGPYRVLNVDVESLAVYTNNPPCGAMRGFGVNQAAFAFESCLDLLAEKVGLDGWEMRWLNALDMGDVLSTGQRMDKPFGLRKTLELVKDDYRSARFAGIACGIKNVGIGNGMIDQGKACLKVEDDGTVTILIGFTEMGQGLMTVCIQVACEETGLPPETFQCLVDTSEDLDCGQTTASRATVLAGNAVKDAAIKLKAAIDAKGELNQLVGEKFFGYWACTDTNPPEADVPNPKTHLTYGYATQVVILNDDGSLKKVVAAHDVGRVINPALLEGQMEGAIHMGLGYALTEEFELEKGYLKTKKVNDCGVLRAHQMPEVEVMFVEEPDPETPYGARGVGEIGLVPTAAAVAGALYAYDGIRRYRLPMKDSPAAQAILKPSQKS